MIAGLPWASWVLLLVSVLVPLAVVVRFHRAHRSRPRDDRDHPRAPGGGR